MEKISYRELQRMSSGKLLGILPCGVTVDSQGIAIILNIKGYKRLLEGYRQIGENSADAIPLYNPAIHKVGDRVLVRKGRTLVPTVVPEIDDEGNIVPEY